MNAIKLVLWLTFSPLQHRSHVLCLVTDKYVLKLNNSTALSNFTRRDKQHIKCKH